MTKLSNLTDKELQQRIERLNRERYKLRKRNERMRTHLMCQMAGYVLTDILNYTEEDLYNFQDFSLEKWQSFCNKHKDEILECTKTK